MSVSTELRPTRRRLFVVIGVVIVMVVGLLAGRLGDDDLVDGSGTLTVDGVVYRFTPTTCLISDEDFVATGTGFDDGEQFWVSASSVGLDLAVGTESEIDEPADDQLWLINNESVDWKATGNTVTAWAPMTDQRSPTSTTVVGALELRCESQDI